MMAKIFPAMPYLAYALCLGFATAGFIFRGGEVLSGLRPPSDVFEFCRRDFSQEWLSAKNFFARMPVYAEQPAAIRVHLGDHELGECKRLLRYNAHPPGTVLLAVPLGLLSFANAFIAWTAASLAAFAIAFLIIHRIVYGTSLHWGALPAALLVVSSHPFQASIQHGQINCFLLLILSAAWLADVLGRWRFSGALIASATYLKLFPGLFLVMLAFKRDFKAMLSGVFCAGVLALIGLVILGAENHRHYVRDILPSISQDHLANANNHSLPGLWCELFNPRRPGIQPLWHSPHAERIANAATYLAAGGLLWWVSQRATNGGNAEGLFPLTVTLAVLLSPVAWNHYSLLLLLPIVWLYRRLRPLSLAWWVLSLCSVLLWLPDGTIWRVMLPAGERLGEVGPITALHTLTGMSLQTYAMIALAALSSWQAVTRKGQQAK